MSKPRNFINGFFSFVIILIITASSCSKEEINPNDPRAYINFTIDPNSTVYHELNTVGGWMYLTADPPSRGVIVYRMSQNEFLAYDRIPPNEPDRCCTGNECTRLIVGEYYPMAYDECNDISYLLLNGSIVEGDGKWPLIQYQTTYNGQLLRIFN
ncbi:MAG: hypothetical protein H0S84_02040 [Bacteroidales bacterium]|jgi:hypothetical protein|nr:hypothetical protein [Bacteroidales bacterium]MDN5349005.1 hypothetical protein [Bacteroidales bacterium]